MAVSSNKECFDPFIEYDMKMTCNSYLPRHLVFNHPLSNFEKKIIFFSYGNLVTEICDGTSHKKCKSN